MPPCGRHQESDPFRGPDSVFAQRISTGCSRSTSSATARALFGTAFIDLLDPEFSGTVDGEGKLPLELPAKGRRLLIVKP